jgi:hypothetical protein
MSRTEVLRNVFNVLLVYVEHLQDDSFDAATCNAVLVEFLKLVSNLYFNSMLVFTLSLFLILKAHAKLISKTNPSPRNSINC